MAEPEAVCPSPKSQSYLITDVSDFVVFNILKGIPKQVCLSVMLKSHSGAKLRIVRSAVSLQVPPFSTTNLKVCHPLVCGNMLESVPNITGASLNNHDDFNCGFSW